MLLLASAALPCAGLCRAQSDPEGETDASTWVSAPHGTFGGMRNAVSFAEIDGSFARG